MKRTRPAFRKVRAEFGLSDKGSNRSLAALVTNGGNGPVVTGWIICSAICCGTAHVKTGSILLFAASAHCGVDYLMSKDRFEPKPTALGIATLRTRSIQPRSRTAFSGPSWTAQRAAAI